MRGNRNLIPISALVTFGTITLASLAGDPDRNGTPTHDPRLPTSDQWLGFVMAYFIIAILADLGVPLAGGFAVLTMVAVLLRRGPAAIGYAMKQQRQQQRAHPRGAITPTRPGRVPRVAPRAGPGGPGGAPELVGGTIPLDPLTPGSAIQPLSPGSTLA